MNTNAYRHVPLQDDTSRIIEIEKYPANLVLPNGNQRVILRIYHTAHDLSSCQSGKRYWINKDDQQEELQNTSHILVPYFIIERLCDKQATPERTKVQTTENS